MHVKTSTRVTHVQTFSQLLIVLCIVYALCTRSLKTENKHIYLLNHSTIGRGRKVFLFSFATRLKIPSDIYPSLPEYSDLTCPDAITVQKS